MTGPMLAGIFGILGALVLVGGALRGQRLSAARTGRLAAIWVGIILAVWAAVTIGAHLR